MIAVVSVQPLTRKFLHISCLLSSFIETPGSNLTLETLARLAAVFKVGLVVKFVPFHEMLAWENQYSQDAFDVVRLDKDEEFLNPPPMMPYTVKYYVKEDSHRDVREIEKPKQLTARNYNVLDPQAEYTIDIGPSSVGPGAGRRIPQRDQQLQLTT